MPIALSWSARKTLMLEVGQILGWLSAIVLLMAFVAWWKPDWRPLRHRTGGPVDSNPAPLEGAPRLLLSAVGISTVAAILAVTGCLFQ